MSFFTYAWREAAPAARPPRLQSCPPDVHGVLLRCQAHHPHHQPGLSLPLDAEQVVEQRPERRGSQTRGQSNKERKESTVAVRSFPTHRHAPSSACHAQPCACVSAQLLGGAREVGCGAEDHHDSVKLSQLLTCCCCPSLPARAGSHLPCSPKLPWHRRADGW